MARPLLSDRVIEKIRDINESAMPDTCTVHNKTSTPDNRGGRTETTGPALATYKCRQSSAFSAEKAQGGSIVTVSRWTLTLERGAVVTGKQIVMLGGVKYEVVGDAGGSYNVNPKVIIERVA